MIVAAVPVKDLDAAKRRLTRVLRPPERRALARAMLIDVLQVLGRARLGGVWVVTCEAEVAELARALGAQVLREPENRGHTAAVALAQAEAARRGARGFLTIPGDVPRVSADEIAALVSAAAETEPAAVFVPSRSGRGTNGVGLAPPDLMPLTFGEPSFDNHLATARRHGLEPRVLRLPGLGLDIDGPDDLAALLAEGATTESGRLLGEWGVAARLQSERIRAAASPTLGPRRSDRRFERGLCPRNPALGEASEGAPGESEGGVAPFSSLAPSD